MIISETVVTKQSLEIQENSHLNLPNLVDLDYL